MAFLAVVRIGGVNLDCFFINSVVGLDVDVHTLLY